jgi:hypothetical protein
MATQYEALPGGDGGAWVPQEQAPRHLQPVQATTAGQPRRKMPIKTREIAIEEEGYEGWHATVRTNAPLGIFLKFGKLAGVSNEEALAIMDEMIGALPQLVTAWDFVDTEGNDLPITAEGFGQLPKELLFALVNAVSGAMGEESAVPKA